MNHWSRTSLENDNLSALDITISLQLLRSCNSEYFTFGQVHSIFLQYHGANDEWTIFSFVLKDHLVSSLSIIHVSTLNINFQRVDTYTYSITYTVERSSVSVMHLLTYLNLGLGELAYTKLIVELADRTVKYPKGIAENVLVRIGKFTLPVDFIILDMREDVKVPLILGRPFLSTAHAKIDVYKRKTTLRLMEEKIIFKSVKPVSSLIKRDYMLSLRERMKPNLEARLMGETLPTIEECEVIKEFRTRDENLDTGIDDYPSYYDNDKKIYIDCAHNLKFSCMIGFEFTHVNFFPLLYVNVMSKKFHNSIMKDKMVYKGDNVVGALMNVPIFVGTFFVVTDFAVLEDMDAYRDEGMGDVIVGEPFLREVGIKARRFDGMITVYNGDDEVTYQMVRLHLRFKHHTNKQCNKIPPLLKDLTLSEFRQWKNGSYAGMLACMRWNGKEKLKTSVT
ncbi:putative reverse transcriptase domain-containing protein [Tanacetum coccineum]|uniref:Reverse transcriptase domain-containing protein n=1 Tax=Tanacetum coccineum TaxID=301880 RepID=A0ABQ5B0T0_9ASTR